MSRHESGWARCHGTSQGATRHGGRRPWAVLSPQWLYLEGVEEDNGHDNAVDGNGLAEDDAGQRWRTKMSRGGGREGGTSARAVPPCQRRPYLMRFLVLMRGAMTPPPRMLLPVMKMPLGRRTGVHV